MTEQMEIDFEAKKTFLQELMNKPKREDICPCCNRFAKVYKRHLHATVASQLIRLYNLGGASQYIHTSNLVVGSGTGDFVKAKYWDLIKPNPAQPTEGKKTNGSWKLTEKGIAFVNNQEKISQYVLIWQDVKLAETGEQMDITEILQDKFSYRELMAR